MPWYSKHEQNIHIGTGQRAEDIECILWKNIREDNPDAVYLACLLNHDVLAQGKTKEECLVSLQMQLVAHIAATPMICPRPIRGSTLYRYTTYEHEIVKLFKGDETAG